MVVSWGYGELHQASVYSVIRFFSFLFDIHFLVGKTIVHSVPWQEIVSSSNIRWVDSTYIEHLFTVLVAGSQIVLGLHWPEPRVGADHPHRPGMHAHDSKAYPGLCYGKFCMEPGIVVRFVLMSSSFSMLAELWGYLALECGRYIS